MDRFSEVEQSEWFQHASSPYLLLDSDFRVRGANAAFVDATETPAGDILGNALFDVFPENPSFPESDGVINAAQSMEFVLRSGRRHCMGVQRYDLPDRQRPGEFTTQIWAPVNHPIKDGAETIAVLHHTEKLTPLIVHPHEQEYRLAELQQAAAALRQLFPMLPKDEVLSVLARSQLSVAATLGNADLAKATELATLRLEVQTGRQARMAAE